MAAAGSLARKPHCESKTRHRSGPAGGAGPDGDLHGGRFEHGADAPARFPRTAGEPTGSGGRVGIDRFGTEGWESAGTNFEGHGGADERVPSVRAFVNTLVQSDIFGTSIAKTLRIYSDTLRTQRRQKAEEQAAKTTVKLVLPLVIFIFPSIFVVVLAPSMISMSESFAQFFWTMSE